MIAFLRAAALATALTVPFTLIAHAEAPTPTLSLSAEGTVHAAPDTAIVTTGVVSEKATVGEALSENNAAMRKLLEALMAAGIADRDMGTSGFSIEPVTVYPEPREDGTQDPPRITGYRVSNQVTVKIREIAKAGDLLDQVVRIGANQIHGVVFTVDDPKALLDRARTEAMKAVQAKAKVYAEAGGFTVGRILSVQEGGGYLPPMPMMAKMAGAADLPAESVPFAMGEQELTISVSVTWEIGQQP